MTHADDYAERETKRHITACDLAVVASRLRDADDALVAHGRAIRDGDAGRGMPDHDEGVRAVALCEDVAAAYVSMLDAETAYKKAGGES